MNAPTFTPTTPTITAPQFATARALAGALGHLWAKKAAHWAAREVSLQEIEEAVRQALEDEDPEGLFEECGILCPSVADGCVKHISGNGSIRYFVRDDGSAEVLLREGAGGHNTLKACVAISIACVALASRGVKVHLAEETFTHKDDARWGMPIERVLSRLAHETVARGDNPQASFEAHSPDLSDERRAMFLDFCSVAVRLRGDEADEQAAPVESTGPAHVDTFPRRYTED